MAVNNPDAGVNFAIGVMYDTYTSNGTDDVILEASSWSIVDEYRDLLIYTSQKYPGIDEDSKRARDMIYADKDDVKFVEVNEHLKYYLHSDANVLLTSVLTLKELIPHPFDKVFDRCIHRAMNGPYWGGTIPDYVREMSKPDYEDHDHVYSNESDQYPNWRWIPRDYSNSDLTEAIFNHKNVKKYVKEFKTCLRSFMVKHHNKADEITIKELRDYMNTYVDAIYFGHFYGRYSTPKTIEMALVLLVHSIWAVRIEITDLTVFGNNTYRGHLKVTLFDHFGFDEKDIDKEKVIAGNTFPFLSWYTLQHRESNYSGYRPFIITASKVFEFDEWS